MTGRPVDPGARARWRAERRAAARRLHPDLGGDAQALIAAFAEIDAKYAPQPRASSTQPWNRLRRKVNRQVRRSRRGIRTLRSRLPRGVPGARRYIEL